MSSIRGAKKVINDLKRNGYEAYIVGGAVRDHLLRKPFDDVDITTNARPYQVAKIFKTKPTGLKYGTVTVLMGDEAFEVTTYRIDGVYLDSRHPEAVIYTESVIDDVKRRDFKINGLLMTEKEEIIDYVEGRKDLENKIISTIGNAYDRFNEDALRIIRAFYFQAKLGFQIEKETRQAITDLKDNLSQIAMERILTELIKTFKQPYLKKAIKSIVTTNVHQVLPGLEKGFEYVQDLEQMPFIDAFFTLCFTLHGSVPSNWPFSNVHRHRYQLASQLAKQYQNFDMVTLYTYGIELCTLANKVNFILKRSPNQKSKIEKDFANLPIKSELDLKLRAPDVMKLTNQKAGAWLGNLQKQMVFAVLNNEVENTKEALESYVLKQLKK